MGNGHALVITVGKIEDSANETILVARIAPVTAGRMGHVQLADQFIDHFGEIAAVVDAGNLG